jgi:hypothetical protein
MKKFSILALAAAGLLFGACTSDKDVAEAQSGGGLTENGQGYFKVGINLPSSAGTRADWNEEGNASKLHDGKSTEWGVESTCLLIFSGSSESTATLAQVNTFTDDYDKDDTDTPNQVTSRKEYVVELTASRESNLYALAVVNGTGVIEQGTGNTIKINGGLAVSGITLADLQSALATASPSSMSNLAGGFVNNNGHIFMTNVVLSDKQGGQTEPAGASTYTLATVDKSKIAISESAAQNSQCAADIYVERGVAKVTIGNTPASGETYPTLSTTATGGIEIAGGATFTATLDGWCLDNTNKSTYLVRNVDQLKTQHTSWMPLVSDGLANNSTTDKYRFVGQSTVIGGDATTGYRTYWCYDPNYEKDYNADNFYSPATKAFVSTFGDDNPLYCFENTFDVAHQSVKNTTRVILKVKLNGGQDFYTINGDRKTIYPVNEMKKQVVNYLFSNGTFRSYYATNGLPESNDNNLKKKYEEITVTFNYGTKTTGSPGLVTVSGITIPQVCFNGATADYTVPNEVITSINSSMGRIRFYNDGWTYYTIRVQHFGDDLTPWNSGEYGSTAPEENTIAKIYPGTSDVQNKNYLGRYGMVRNNWYLLNIGNVVKIGKPVIPDISGTNNPDPDEPDNPDDPDNPDHPDDSLDEVYIKARINILSWAKRPQSWDLK